MTTTCKPCATDPNSIDNEGNCTPPTTIDAQTPPATTPGACVVGPDGTTTCPEVSSCSPWDLTDGPEDCIISNYIEEQLNISGAVLKVHKLLGIHEQGLLIDVTGVGSPISSGDLANNPSSNAFDKYITEWRSKQTGANVLASAYIGYDFGPIKLDNGRLRYGIDTAIMKDISTIKIMQGCDSKNRATKIRIERSEDGKKWFGVTIATLADCDGILTVTFNRSVPSRYWRIRPIQFNGGQNDYWAVRVLQLVEYEATSLYNIQDKILLENRDRDYQEFPVDIRAAYTPQENFTMFDRFGFNPIGDSYVFEVSFNAVLRLLGRPMVIGDILMVPSERQYTSTMRPIDKYLEVTDIFWSSNGFTPTWKPTLQKIVAKPLLASQETQDISGKLTADIDNTGLYDIDDGNVGKKYQDYMDVNDSIRAEYKKNVPEKGIDYANAQLVSEELKAYAKKNPNMNVEKLNTKRMLAGIDAMPPNGLPYTQGDEFPKTPKNGDYHRLTYESLGANIPVRLHKYSSAKARWIFMETDNKAVRNSHRPYLTEYIASDGSSTRTPLDEIDDVL